MLRGLALFGLLAVLSVPLAGAARAADVIDDLPTIAEAVNEALEFQKTGATVTWTSSSSGNAGTITVLRTFFRGGAPCRDYERTLVQGGVLRETVTGTGCRSSDGIWSLQEGGPGATIVPAALPAPSGAPPVEVGSAERIVVWAYRTPPNLERADLHVRQDVFSQELLETVPKGALHVRLLDDGQIRLGSESQVRLDEFVYNPAAGTGKVTASIGKGVCRFITGKVKGDNFQVRSPTALIGARGTDFVVAVAASGATIVHVNSGSVMVNPLTGAPPRALNPGETLGIDPAGGTTTRLPPPRDAGLESAAATVPTSDPPTTVDPSVPIGLAILGLGIYSATRGHSGGSHSEPMGSTGNTNTYGTTGTHRNTH